MPRNRYSRRVGATDVAASTGITDDTSDNFLASILSLPSPGCFFNPTLGVLSGRMRGGTASLCGFDTWIPVNPGPQKKFRFLTRGGSITYCASGNACATNSSSFRTVQSGTCSYDAATCALTNNGLQTVFLGPPDCVTFGASQPPTALCDFIIPVQFACEYITVATVLSLTYTPSGVCCLVGPGAWRQNSGTPFTQVLSAEDTEADAIARLLAANPYPAFAPCGAPVSCTLAQYEQRGNVGFSFVYGDAQARGNWAGLHISEAYCVQFDIYRRLYGVGPYVLFTTIQLVANSDGAGNMQVDINVPNTIGYQTYADIPRAYSRYP